MVPEPSIRNELFNLISAALELQRQGVLDKAEAAFREVLRIKPDEPAALYSLGVILYGRGDLEGALDLFGRCCTTSPGFADGWFGYANALQSAGEREKALAAYDKAVEARPEFIGALINSGVLLRDMYRHRDALGRFNQALEIEPDNPGALGNSAILLTEFRESARAIAQLERLVAHHPDYDYAFGLLAYERLHIGDWTDFEGLRQRILAGIREGKRVCKSLAFMALSDSAKDQFECAKIFASHFCPPPQEPLWNGKDYRHRKLRIAYVSPDLREHPVGHLMCGIFENHDKTRVETIAISLGVDDRSSLRARMLNAFDHFIDARAMSSRKIAEKMREMEVDIAIDLAGYTSDSRIDIFSWRPAPVHINFLGYPGSLAVDYMDYILADRHVIPPEKQQFFSEKVLYLPDTYLPTDCNLKVADATPSRESCGLPPEGIVYCSFSHDYKISPPLWKVWMSLLQKTPGSVLWLVARNELTRANFRRSAQEFGIEPARLVFAERVPRIEDHLARYRLADLFLDTWPYNAHTTAADALYAGLPVVTYMGDAFPSRVAGSLLHAIGLSELATGSWEDYEALALKLVSDRESLAELKARLLANKTTHPLFDTRRFCRNLESILFSVARTSILGEQDEDSPDDHVGTSSSEHSVSRRLQDFAVQHIAPLEARLASRERTLAEIAQVLCAGRVADDGPAGRVAQLLRKEGVLPGGDAVPTAVERLYTAHVDFDRVNTQNDKVFELFQRTDIVGWWRVKRFLEPVFKCLSHTKQDRWMTVGDPFGADAYHMIREGFQSVLPTSIGDHLLKQAKQRGLISDYRVENAEALSLPDNSVDYVLCKEAYHHFPRPMLALYEMLRVARKGVVLIEPQDPLIDSPTHVGDLPAGYEDSGNYIYTLSRRELHKAALGLDLPAVATRGLYDLWYDGASEILAREDNPEFVEYRRQVESAELLCSRQQQKYNYLLAIVYKERPDIDLAQFSEAWLITSFPGNPYLSRK